MAKFFLYKKYTLKPTDWQVASIYGTWDAFVYECDLLLECIIKGVSYIEESYNRELQKEAEQARVQARSITPSNIYPFVKRRG